MDIASVQLSLGHTHSTVGSCSPAPSRKEKKLKETVQEGGREESDCDFVLLFYAKKKTKNKKPKKTKK